MGGREVAHLTSKDVRAIRAVPTAVAAAALSLLLLAGVARAIRPIQGP